MITLWRIYFMIWIFILSPPPLFLIFFYSFFCQLERFPLFWDGAANPIEKQKSRVSCYLFKLQGKIWKLFKVCFPIWSPFLLWTPLTLSHTILWFNPFTGVDIKISSALAPWASLIFLQLVPQVLNLPKGLVGFYSSLSESNYCVNSVLPIHFT